MKRGRDILLALGTLALAASVAAAQTPPPAGLGRGEGQGRGAGQPPPPMTNLQLFPKDTPREQVVAVMQQFTQSLGVECNYCHVQEGRGGRNDFASDEKQPKKTARQMMIFARELNEKLPTVVSKSADATTKVGCSTCHRGVPIPKLLPETLTATATEKGMPAAIAQYRELRAKFYGGQSYDFSENGLIFMAQRMPPDKADDALQWLQLNAEFNPKSARTYVVMSQIYGRKNDKANQIKSLEKAAELAPDNQQIKGQLERLKGSGQ